MIEFETHIAGIPCIIEATWMHQAPACKALSLCESPDEAFGIDEIEYNVLDRKGYPAVWLERKITPEIEDKLFDEIRQAYEDAELDAQLSAAGL